MYSREHLITISLIILLMAMRAQVDAADQATIDYICKQSQDYNFCMKTFKDDPRTPRADFHGLALLSITHTISQVQETSKKLRGIKMGDKQRLAVCQSDYDLARDQYRVVYKTVSQKDYLEAISEVQAGTSEVENCQDIYWNHVPIEQSPVTDDYFAVNKLQEIILIILDILGNSE